MPDAAPAGFQEIGHRLRRGSSFDVSLGDQATGQSIRAHRRLAWTHPRAGPPTEVFERPHRRILEPRRRILRTDELALAEQRLQRSLIAMWFGQTKLRRPMSQLVHLVLAVIEGNLGGAARGGHP